METQAVSPPLPVTPPQQRLAGKVAIITGGASGIGATTAQLFHENGAKVVIADIQDTRGRALAKTLGENATYIHCDVQEEADVINLIDRTVAKYGKLDIMYNNAGIIDRAFTTILETKKSDLDRLVSVNLVGAFLGAKHAAKVMIPRKNGCVLFTSSACTQIGGIASQSYAVTKYGICGLAQSLASELKQHGIRVNCISPFGLATDIGGRLPECVKHVIELALSSVGNLKGQILRPDDVAKAALYLASDEGNCVSGVNLLVDGGFSSVNPSMIRAFGNNWNRFINLGLAFIHSSRTAHLMILLMCVMVLLVSVYLKIMLGRWSLRSHGMVVPLLPLS